MKKSFIISALIAVVVMTIFAVRLMQWQLVETESYQKLASSSSAFVKLEASRGEILDRNGEDIVSTTSVYNVVMNALEIDGDRNIALEKLINLMNKNDIKWINVFPIELNSYGKYAFTENAQTEKEYLFSVTGQELNAEDCVKFFVEKYDCENYTSQMCLDIISIRYNMTKTNFSVSEAYVIASDVDMNFVQKVEEQSQEMPGIEIRVGTSRTYENGFLAPHIVGTVGAISSEQYVSFSENDNIYSSVNVSGYSLADKVGQSGIEYAFEDVLRGKNGKQLIETDEDGNSYLGEITEVPSTGGSVSLTIDKNLQEVLNYSLEKNIQTIDVKDEVTGAAVVLDIETFGVLAASTYPTYDLGLYTSDMTYYTNLLEDETTPLFNRAFSGVYPPGSVMKPAVALASLEEGVIDDKTTVYCDKTYDYYSQYPLACIGSHEVGDVDIYHAISSSCNSFFCESGRLLGIEAMEVYANLFGLGTKTGIEIAESKGTMTNPTEYEENHSTAWVDGVTIQAAIGQADSTFTPLQLATYVATIANDGVRLETHLLNKITDYETGEVIEKYEPTIAETIDISKDNIKIVQDSMKLVASDGTASRIFGDYEVEIAAKTGTAQNNGHADTVNFIAYAPFDNPEIAIAVTLEYGDSGIFSRKVAKDLFDAYFFGTTLEDLYAFYEVE